MENYKTNVLAYTEEGPREENQGSMDHYTEESYENVGNNPDPRQSRNAKTGIRSSNPSQVKSHNRVGRKG